MWTSVVGSALTIGFGGSVGAEAPIVLTGAAIGSNLAKFFRLDQKTMMLMIGCGAAGAIGGIDLTYRHFIIGYNVSVGFTKLCDAGFMGNPLDNVITAVLLGGHPKNITADISIGYQF